MNIRRASLNLGLMSVMGIAAWMPTTTIGAPPTLKEKSNIPNPNIVPLKPYVLGTITVPASPTGLALSCSDIVIGAFGIQADGIAAGQAGAKLSSASLTGHLASGTCSYKVHAPQGQAFLMQLSTQKTCPAAVATEFVTGANEAVLPIGPLQMVQGEVATVNIKVFAIRCAHG